MLLADDGQPRNARSASVHGFLSRDGADPAEMPQAAHRELGRYPSIRLRDTTVHNAALTDQELLFTDAYSDAPAATASSPGGHDKYHSACTRWMFTRACGPTRS